MTINFIHPSLILICGALILPFIREPFRKLYLTMVPSLALLAVVFMNLNPGVHGVISFMGGDWTLTFGRVDNLSIIFGFIMALMAVIGTFYGLHVKDNWQHIAA